MHLLSCKNPKRIYNKYIDDYVWVPCGECNICKNRRAAHYTALLERERLQHRYAFFVTLTYDNRHLPYLSFGDFVQRVGYPDQLVSSRAKDNICITFNDLFPDDKKDCYTQADIDFFNGWISHGGLPYASRSDIQLFNKRLNKYIHDHVTCQFKNFRYFIVSEFGCTTFRSHFHGIFYVDNPKLADEFANCVVACWKFGIVDIQPVENSACAYVAQYINKSSDMPYVYQHKSLRPFFLCSRNPFIGAFSECPSNDAEIVNNSSVTQAIRAKGSDTSYTVVPLEQSYQNRLFPKCPLYGTIPDSLKYEFYSIGERFRGKNAKEFMNLIYDMVSLDAEYKDSLSVWLRGILKFSDVKDELYKFDHREAWKLFDEYSFNLLRRIYYTSVKVARQAKLFGISVFAYVKKIIQYYANKELYLLKEQYNYQSEIAQFDSDSIALMYPEFLFKNGITISDWQQQIDSRFAQMQIDDSDFWAFSNKKTHFKNAYLDSLQYKKDCYFLYCLIKAFYYAKECNEAIEAIAP